MFLGWKSSSSWTVKSALFASTDTQESFSPSPLLNQALQASSQVFWEWDWGNAPSSEYPNTFILTDPPKTAMITSTVELPWRKNWLPVVSKTKIRLINVDRNVSGMELWVLPYTMPKMHLKNVFTCCNCRKSEIKDLSAYFQIFLNSIATRKRAVLRRCNFETITLKLLERKKGGEKNKPEIIPSLAFSLPSNKLTCLEQKKKNLVLLQSPRHCKHQPEEK